MNKLEDNCLGNKRPIGVYDSGIGGLTVLKKLIELMPNENYIYFADNIHLPYGERTKQQIINYSRSIMSWLQNKMHAKVVVAACHTSSSLALEELEAEFDTTIIGTIHPITKHIITNNQIKKISVIATPASASSLMHEKILYNKGFKGEIQTIACPAFVKLAESEETNSSEIHKYCAEYLSPLAEFLPDSVIYGCTHYPFLSDEIEKILPSNISYIDPGLFIADEVLKHLKHKNLCNNSKGSIEFYCSQPDIDLFKKQIQRLMHDTNLTTKFADPHSYDTALTF